MEQKNKDTFGNKDGEKNGSASPRRSRKPSERAEFQSRKRVCAMILGLVGSRSAEFLKAAASN